MPCYSKKCIWTSPKASLIRIIPHILATFTSLFMGLNKPLDLRFNVFPLLLRTLVFMDLHLILTFYVPQDRGEPTYADLR